ncbi:MAG TPA: nitrogenase iron-molybdenum cofactor biosynthesis protein NifE [Actinobacteria bacterium]|nr:nitrogenase iron-molybdenum cofactor biosynthesis protein NifE [Actinomycetota bacterium]
MTEITEKNHCIDVISGREGHILQKTGGGETTAMACDADSVAGAVSQRACVFCGARVVIYPIADALHLIHGPIGCSTYTWDIRGSLSSGPELHRFSFSTDLQEQDIIFGGEPKLYRALCELIDKHQPQGAFVYSTCIVGVIGDDLKAVCARVEREKGIRVIPVQSEGFKGNKNAGYKAACQALFELIGSRGEGTVPLSINILGDFNLAGEIWIIREYLEKMGIRVVANISGDSRVAHVARAHTAALNVVQCSGSMMHLARMMKKEYGIPFIRVSYFGSEDMAASLRDIAAFFGDEGVNRKTGQLIKHELDRLLPQLEFYREKLAGKKAAVYVGGAFKAISLIKAFRDIGMQVVVVGSQTGKEQDYEDIKDEADPGTVIIDDANPLELAQLMKNQGVDIFVGGVKERPVAYKLGIAFCDHNHERKLPLEGFIGMSNFAKEVYSSIASPVWQWVPRADLASEVEKHG